MKRGNGEMRMYRYERKVQYHETDKMGITHHANYVKWMEEARVAYLEAVGLPFEKIEAEGIVSPVVRLTIDYKLPSTFGDTVTVLVSVERYNGFLFEISYRMIGRDGEETIAEAHSSHCFMKNGRIVSLKRSDPSMHELLENAFSDDRREERDGASAEEKPGT